MPQRKPISKTLRFEVFKRDSFKCQYCGAAAPDVLLHVDHIQPVSLGGANEVVNLVTACVSCNAGKSDRPLTENVAVAKQRAHLEELQDRREQLEMLLEWKQGLNALKEDTVGELCAYWHRLAPGATVSDHGRRNVQKWLRRYDLAELLHGMDVAAEQYLVFTEAGTVSIDSWEEAFAKIPAICRVTRESRDNPDVRELYYIRGIARNNCAYFNGTEALSLLRAARSWDVPLQALRQIAVEATSWTRFRNDLCDIIDEYRAHVERPTPPESKDGAV